MRGFPPSILKHFFESLDPLPPANMTAPNWAADFDPDSFNGFVKSVLDFHVHWLCCNSGRLVLVHMILVSENTLQFAFTVHIKVLTSLSYEFSLSGA